MNNYRHVTIAFILTALLLAAIVGVYQYQQQKINSLVSQQLPVATPIPTISHSDPATVGEESISTWQSFSNDIAKVSFQYPNAWKLTVENAPKIFPEFNNEVQGSIILDGGLVGSIYISLGSGTGGPLCKTIGGKIRDLFVGTKTEKGCYQNIEKYFILSTSCADCSGVVNENIIYNLKVIYTSGAPEGQKLVNQILSTFKFTQ